MLFRYPVVALVTSLFLGANALSAKPEPPADPQLNAKARAILAYIQQLQAGPGLRLLSGQFAGWSGTATLEELARIERATGQWPALIGLDYCTWASGEAAINVTPPNKLAEAYWQAGGLVEISWHAPDPANPDGGGLRDKGVDLGDLLVADSPTHERWLKSLDEIARGLHELQTAGVVVIWRPLHEMNGGWFWWGAQKPATYVAVWRQMFDYFTHTKKLHNLIWAFSPNHGQRPASEYYAGDAYTDLVGTDAYTDDVDPAHILGYAEFARINKPFGFTEFGPHGASHPPGSFDYRRFLDGVAKNFPTACHFLCWNEKWNPASNGHAREFYSDPRVITRARLPAGLAGP
jgi:mannan endo-1,4-beta-mannosidase